MGGDGGANLRLLPENGFEVALDTGDGLLIGDVLRFQTGLQAQLEIHARLLDELEAADRSRIVNHAHKVNDEERGDVSAVGIAQKFDGAAFEPLEQRKGTAGKRIDRE